MKKNFKAAVLFKLNEPLKLISINYPKNIGRGRVLVKIKNAAVCGAQINEIRGIKGKDKYLPHMMGHEGYGQVIKLGDGVKRFKIGDEVIMHWRKSKGLEADGFKYDSKYGLINSGQVTTFSEFAVVSENRLTKFKLNNKLKTLAPLFGCCLTTAYGIVYKEAKMKKNKNLLIIGCGGLGLAIATFAKIVGVKNIDFIDINFPNSKKKYIKSLGLKNYNLISANKIDVLKKKYNYVLDTSGKTKNISHGFNYLDKNSDLILVGQPKIKKKLNLDNPLSFFNGKKIYASDGGRFNPNKDFKRVVNIVNNNSRVFLNLVSNSYKLRKINLGIKKLMRNEVLRVIINN